MKKRVQVHNQHKTAELEEEVVAKSDKEKPKFEKM